MCAGWWVMGGADKPIEGRGKITNMWRGGATTPDAFSRANTDKPGEGRSRPTTVSRDSLQAGIIVLFEWVHSTTPNTAAAGDQIFDLRNRRPFHTEEGKGDVMLNVSKRVLP